MLVDEKRIVLSRLESFPISLRVMVKDKTLKREGLIKEVKNETEIGECLVKLYMDEIKSYKNIGKLR